MGLSKDPSWPGLIRTWELIVPQCHESRGSRPVGAYPSKFYRVDFTELHFAEFDLDSERSRKQESSSLSVETGVSSCLPSSAYKNW